MATGEKVKKKVKILTDSYRKKGEMFHQPTKDILQRTQSPTVKTERKEERLENNS